MKVNAKKPPRQFEASGYVLRDCGTVELSADEQVTFRTADGRRYDVAAKSWGFYATPSVNGRLKQEGFRTALTRNAYGKHFVVLVAQDRMSDFMDYLTAADNEVVEWLDER